MNLKSAKTISHTGIVREINGQKVSVLISQNSACGTCAAAHLCHSAESREKVIEAWCASDKLPQVGQEVVIYGTLGQGMMAALLAYVLPLLLVVSLLFVLIACQMSEAVAALWALLSLVPYYALLHFLQDRLARKLTFYIMDN